jgi:SAM-dependent methyltransferase
VLAAPLVRRVTGHRVAWAPARRTMPISDPYGEERGTPVDRFYIDAFMKSMSDTIQGDVLEVQSPLYTRRFGGSKVTAAHVLDVDASNRRATVVADLCASGSLPSRAYDCVIVTQTMQYLADEAAALANIWQALRPGGVLLMTVPCLAALDPAYLDADYWRYTPAGLASRLRSVLPEAVVEVSAGGNVLACSAYLYGFAVEDLTEDELAVRDQRFPLTAFARVSKSATG